MPDAVCDALDACVAASVFTPAQLSADAMRALVRVLPNNAIHNMYISTN